MAHTQKMTLYPAEVDLGDRIVNQVTGEAERVYSTGRLSTHVEINDMSFQASDLVQVYRERDDHYDRADDFKVEV